MEPVHKQFNESCKYHSGDGTVIMPVANQILTFGNMIHTAKDLTNIDRQITSLIFDKCNSDEWN
jgi:hypothetical protein